MQIDLHDNRLTVRGERKREGAAKEEQYHRVERLYARFERGRHGHAIVRCAAGRR